jgi:hypothetical protein
MPQSPHLRGSRDDRSTGLRHVSRPCEHGSSSLLRQHRRSHRLPCLWRTEQLRRSQLRELGLAGHRCRGQGRDELQPKVPGHQDRAHRLLPGMSSFMSGEAVDTDICNRVAKSWTTPFAEEQVLHLLEPRWHRSRQPSSWATRTTSTACLTTLAHAEPVV